MCIKAKGRWIERQDSLSRVRELSSWTWPHRNILCGHVYEEGQCCFCSCSAGSRSPPLRLDGLRADWLGWPADCPSELQCGHVRRLRDVSHTRGAGPTRAVPDSTWDATWVRVPRVAHTVSLPHFRYAVHAARFFFLHFFFMLFNAYFVIATNAPIVHHVAILIAST